LTHEVEKHEVICPWGRITPTSVQIEGLRTLQSSGPKFEPWCAETKSSVRQVQQNRSWVRLSHPLGAAVAFANDLLELIYLHLYSLRNFEGLILRSTTEQAAAPMEANS
jgi:hypothetical protein